MAKKTVVPSKSPKKATRSYPISSADEMEDHMISLAISLAEKQLKEGTASAQVITHYLKLGSSKERLNKELTSKQCELTEAKTENIKASKEQEELYERVIDAMKQYRGSSE